MPENKTPDPPPDDNIGLITTVTVVVLAGGLILPILVATAGRTAGARSSVRLEHQQRQAEIQRALAQRAESERTAGGAAKP